MTLPLILGAAALVVYLVLKQLNRTTTPKIPGIPAVPGLPFVGSLFSIGECHARKAQEWAQTYGPVFQVRLGNRWIVFANTYDAIHELWIKQQSALISRPTLYTFHNVVSSSQGFTIGTSPWDESCKRRRKAAATALNRPAVESYMPILDLESSASIRELLVDSQYGEKEINPAPYFHRFALNTSLTLNYGYRIKGNVDDAQLREIVDVERAVSNLRSTSNNWQDYLPLLRLFSGRNSEAVEMRKRRDRYMTRLLNELQRRIKEGTDRPCITGNILKDPEAKLNEAEINSICLTMVSAGLDTVPGNLVMGLGYLSTPHGQELQQKCYDAIKKVYPNGEAWDACLREEKVPYITALVKEVLRFWTVIPISLPRVHIKDAVYNGATIPAGTTFFMNAYAGNYDPAHFDDPFAFNPDRYLKPSEGTAHFGYGAGSRLCAGSHLANRELYTAFLRLIVAFKIFPAESREDRPIIDPLDCSRSYTALTLDPKDFKLRLVCRDQESVERWLEGSEMRTKEL